MRANLAVVGALLSVAIGSSAATAEEPFMLDSMPAEHFKMIQNIQKALGSDRDADTARGVYYGATVWPPHYGALKVCFFGGTKEARRLIAEKALDWMRPDLGITLDFGKNGKTRSCKKDSGTEMQIRVGFDEPGYWSYLGYDSVTFIPQDKKSLNLQGLEKVTKDTWVTPNFDRAVHHEFGHALGLGHEHQNPKSPCEDEFDWPKVYELLGGPPNNWPKDQVDYSMRKYNENEVTASAFNIRSVMLYQFDPAFYKAGEKARCYTKKKNSEISEGDRAELAGMYPVDGSSRVARFENARSAFAALWNKSDDESRKAVGFDVFNAIFARPAPSDQSQSAGGED